MNGYLLDTHTWLWVQLRTASEVSTGFFEEVETWQRHSQLFLSDMSVWEVARLVMDGQLDLGVSVDAFCAEATAHDGLSILPITRRIIIESTCLPGDLHRDPADRILVATAREHGFTVVTRDKSLLRYAKAGHLSARKP